jgi:protoporphyrinogen oxidase
MNQVKYLILGAGVSGISAANFLGPNEDYLILEKTDSVGGYCKTIKQDGFTWDYSGHFFHFRYENTREMVMKNIDPDRLLLVQKKTGIVYRDNVISFPFQRNISELPKDEFVECLHDFYFRTEKENYNNFLDWLYGSLGKGIVEKFVKPYNEKLYATNLENLDVNAMGRFFPTTSLEEIMNSMNSKKDDSYNNTFLYPLDGAISYVNSLMKNVDEQKIVFDSEVIHIDTKNKFVSTKSDKYSYEKLISSIPLNNLITISEQVFNEELYRSNKVVVFNLGFDRPSISDFHWLYIPDPEIVFYRVGFYDNILSEYRASMYVEIGMDSHAEFDQDNLLSKVLFDLKSIGLLSDHVLVSKSVVVMNPAYIHLSQNSISDANRQLEKLQNLDIFSIGRYGEWTYCSIEDNIVSASKCIEKVTNE